MKQTTYYGCVIPFVLMTITGAGMVQNKLMKNEKDNKAETINIDYTDTIAKDAKTIANRMYLTKSDSIHALRQPEQDSLLNK